MLGTATYSDDFGQPRPGGAHQGIDIMAPKRSLALAAEAGKVKFWTSSASAGCMLYLHGASGTDYYYIHLNNDLTAKNDNRGKCVAGTAYAKGLKNGAQGASPASPSATSATRATRTGSTRTCTSSSTRDAARPSIPTRGCSGRRTCSSRAPRGMPFTLELRGTIVVGHRRRACSSGSPRSAPGRCASTSRS